MHVYQRLLLLTALVAAAAGQPVALAAPAGAASTDPVYVVRAGDTLIGVAKANLQQPDAWRELARSNRLANPDYLRPGQVLRLPLSQLRAQSQAASLRVINGAVLVDRQAATDGDPLSVGQRLQTPATGSAEIALPDGSLVRVQPNSEVELGEQKRYAIRAAQASENDAVAQASHYFANAMRLIKGSIEVIAAKVARIKPLEISTPTAVVGVRGTHFRVSDDGTSRSEVLEGKVAVATPVAQAPVHGGQGALLLPDRAPDVVPLLPPPSLSDLPSPINHLQMHPPIATPLGTVSLHWQIARDDAFSRIVAHGRMAFDQPLRIDEALADGDYMLRVRAVDSKGIEGTDAVRRITLFARPQAPAWLVPTPGGRVDAGSTTLSWARNTSADRYAIEVARDAAFTQDVQRQSVAQTGHAQFDLLQLGTYHRRIASIDASGRQGPWSQDATLIAREKPAAPSGSLDDQHLLLSWGVGSENLPGVRYEVQLAREDATFSQPLLASATVDEPQWTQPAPQQAGSYYFRYRRIETDGYTSGWSSTMLIEKPHDWGFLFYFVPLLALGLL